MKGGKNVSASQRQGKKQYPRLPRCYLNVHDRLAWIKTPKVLKRCDFRSDPFRLTAKLSDEGGFFFRIEMPVQKLTPNPQLIDEPDQVNRRTSRKSDNDNPLFASELHYCKEIDLRTAPVIVGP